MATIVAGDDGSDVDVPGDAGVPGVEVAEYGWPPPPPVDELGPLDERGRDALARDPPITGLLAVDDAAAAE